MTNRRACTDIPWEDEAESNLPSLDQRQKSKINRLKRSPKPSQPSRTVDTSDITQPEFKTPTRPIRTKFGRLISKDSPCNDYENQHDIIWDQNSPSPIGKEGALHVRGRGRRKVYTGKTDVNDLVSRIAPKNCKPVDSSESSVLQWIGVGGIPCTPELSQPRTKTKLTRQDTHDHLKQLAMQFDFQLIRHEGPLQNKSPVRPPDQQDEDLDLFGDDENQAPRPPANPSPPDAVGALSLDQDMDEDDDKLLNELFDGPTVSIENGLSQPLSVASQNAKPVASATLSTNAAASGRSDAGARGHVLVPSDGTRTGVGNGGAGGLDDDWDDDGLLDDSMVMEITQNPDLFAPPKHCSTQKPHASQPSVPSGTTWPTKVSNQHHQPGCGSSGSRGFGLSQVPSGIYKKGQPLKPGVNSNHQVRTSPVGGGLPSNNSNSVRNSHPAPSSAFPSKSSKAEPATPKALNQPCTGTKTEASAARQCSSPWRPSPSTGARSQPSQATAWPEQHSEAVATVEEPKGDVLIPADDAGFQDDDLDVFFALDCGWDDDVDDDSLLCEACDDVDEGARAPAGCAVATAKQPFSNAQALNQNQNQNQKWSIAPSVTTTGNAEYRTHHQRPDATFAQPFPTSETVYSASGNSMLAKCAPPVTQRTAAMVPGSSNAQNQGMSVRPPTTAGVEATSSFRGSSHQTTGRHLGGVSSNSPTGQFSFNQTRSTRTPYAAAAPAGVEPQRPAHAKENTSTANQLAWKEGGVAGSNQSSMRMGDSGSSQYAFKRPANGKASDNCSTVTTSVSAPCRAPGMCSEAEIERKKQEALERRRLRMLATQNPNQNLRVPC